jgi:hypothetical protein
VFANSLAFVKVTYISVIVAFPSIPVIL